MKVYSKEKVDSLLTGKQDSLTTAQQNAVNSGIDSTKVAQIQTNKDDIDDLKENLADYRGSFDTKALLDAYTGTKNNNDYAVVLADETHSNQCWRYIYSKASTAWTAQYKVNDAPMTQAQLDALNSGANTTNIAQIATNTAAIAGKQDTLVSGTNIKTVGGQSLLGSGDLAAGNVDDVKVNNASVVVNKIASFTTATLTIINSDDTETDITYIVG